MMKFRLFRSFFIPSFQCVDSILLMFLMPEREYNKGDTTLIRLLRILEEYSKKKEKVTKRILHDKIALVYEE